jgi:hypothetical protein
MHVTVDGQSGEIAVRPPLSQPGDRVSFVAETDLVHRSAVIYRLMTVSSRRSLKIRSRNGSA